jgi:very-short-patch-repair endonuclease
LSKVALFYNIKFKKYSQELRKNMTDAERVLWSKLRRRQLKNCQFYRQRIIGIYMVDFYCPQSKLIIEVDGGQHYDDERNKSDRMRDDYLKKLGLKILRVRIEKCLKISKGFLRIYMRFCNPPQSPFKKGGRCFEYLERRSI